MEFIEATLKEHLDWIEPLHGGLALILREDYPEKVGGVFVARDAVDRASRTSRVGVVLKISEHIPFWNGSVDEDAVERKQHLAPGDRIVFDSPTPILCGKSILVNLKGEWPIQMIHVSDIQQKWKGPCRWDGNEELEAVIEEQKKQWQIYLDTHTYTQLRLPDGHDIVSSLEIPST